MRTLLHTMTLAILLILVTGCGKDKSTAPKPTEITGTWTATKVEYTSKTTSDWVEFIIAGGAGTLILGETKRYELRLTPPGGIARVNTGTWSLDGDIMTMTETGMPFSVVFEIRLSGNVLELTGGDVEYDFDNNGIPEQADLDLEFTR